MHGFTIVELLLATSIFSLALLGALAGFLRTGGIFYKGVTLTQTQAVAKQVVDDVSANISSAGTVQSFTSGGGNHYSYYCIGNARYTYALNKEVDLSASPNYSGDGVGNFGLLKDTLPSAGSCPAPCGGTTSCGGGQLPLSASSSELLGDNTRLYKFDVSKNGSSLYDISVTMIYGNNSALNTTTDPPTCIGGVSKQQFCAVTNLTTSVFTGAAS